MARKCVLWVKLLGNCTLVFLLVPGHIDLLMKWVEEGKIRLDDIITHRLPLSKAPKAYEIFNNKEDNCVKVVMTP